VVWDVYLKTYITSFSMDVDARLDAYPRDANA